MEPLEKIKQVRDNFPYDKKIEYINDLTETLDIDFGIKIKHTGTHTLTRKGFQRDYHCWDNEGNTYKLFVQFFWTDKIYMFKLSTDFGFSHSIDGNKPSKRRQKQLEKAFIELTTVSEKLAKSREEEKKTFENHKTEEEYKRLLELVK